MSRVAYAVLFILIAVQIPTTGLAENCIQSSTTSSQSASEQPQDPANASNANSSRSASTASTSVGTQPCKPERPPIGGGGGGGGEQPTFDSEGNQVCTDLSSLIDTDGDGTRDCYDNDDDNDDLTDEVENWLGTTSKIPDSDADGLIDGSDMLPRSVAQITIQLGLKYYDRAGENCDPGTDWADPYIAAWSLGGDLPGGEQALLISPEWQQGTHVVDRPTGPTSMYIAPKLVPSNIGLWAPQLWQVPSLRVGAVLWDDDIWPASDDQMDLSWSAGSSAGIADQRLSVDDPSFELTLSGDAACRARLTFDLDENVNAHDIIAAVAAYSGVGPAKMSDINRVSM